MSELFSPLTTAGIDGLLMLSGLLLIVIGLLWLVLLAFRSSLLWGIGTLLPPLTLLFVLRRWRVARKAVLLGALGFIPLVVGLTMMAGSEPQRLDQLLSLDWARREPSLPPELNIRLNGQFNGQRFAPQRGELIDGLLSLREEGEGGAHRELRIRLQRTASGAVRLDVLPEDRAGLAEIELSWLAPNSQLPQVRELSEGYTLHLDLQPLAPNKLAGDFHLALPAPFATNLNGRVELFTDRLRYRDGLVDTRQDNEDTLRYVVGDYLQRRFATREVRVQPLTGLSWPMSEAEVNVQASVAGRPQRLQVQLKKNPLRGWVVQGDHYPPVASEQPAPAPPPRRAIVQTPAPQQPVGAPMRSAGEPRQLSVGRLLERPARYHGRLMRLRSERGVNAEGRFDGLDNAGHIVIRGAVKPPGEALFRFLPEQVSAIELLEP